MKIMVDVTPMAAHKTGVGYYTERLFTNLAQTVPPGVELVGFYYDFLGRRDASQLPKANNISYKRLWPIPSKVIYQLRRWGIELPIEPLVFARADYILYPNFLDHPSLFHTPSAPVVHDLAYLDKPECVAPKLRRDLARSVPRALKRSRFVITVSDFTKQRLVEVYGLAPGNILVTPIPPLPVKPIAPADQRRQLQSLGISKPFILFVGTIDPRKNIPGLVDGYTELPKALRDKFSLVISGRVERLGAPAVEHIKRAQAKGFDVIHAGYTTDEAKNALFHSASLFVSASAYEGFGMPILEAMSYGLPCAVSDIPIFREVGGSAVVYFDHTKPTAIAQAMQRLLSDPARAKRLTIAGKTWVRRYDWHKIATSVYERIQASLS